jgi:hypothetical protein
MKKQIVILVVLALVFFATTDWQGLFGAPGTDAMHSGQIHPPLAYTDGWYVEFYYMDADTCSADSLSSFADTLYTNWIYAGPDWETFWVYFDWYGSDTMAQLDSLDSLESVTIQGCLDPVNYPTTINYSTFFENKADTFTALAYHKGLDSLEVDPPYPYVRAEIIFEYTLQAGHCAATVDTIKGAAAATHNKELFEIRWKFLDIY